MVRDLCNALFLNGSIVTTKQKASVARRHAERAITIAKKGTKVAQDRIHSLLNHKEAEEILWSQIASEYAMRNGGYTRVIRLNDRRGDKAQMVRLELV